MLNIIAIGLNQKNKNLTSILGGYLDLLINSEIRNQIINAYTFGTPAALFTLHNKKDDQIEQFIKDLDELFYAGAISFRNKLNKSKLILLSRFKNLFGIAFHYYSYKWDPKLDNLADLSHVVSGKSLKNLSKYCSKERVRKLAEIMDNYTHLYSDYFAKGQITRAFIGAKPVTTIELYKQDIEAVLELTEKLEDYFLVGQVSFDSEPDQSLFTGDIVVSRFKNPFDIIMRFATKGFGLKEWFADLSGFFVRGGNAKEVAWYCCHKKQVKGYNLVK